MAETHNRPLSPHLSIWRWGPPMALSILHRVTGAGLSIVGLGVLTWWLMALSGGPESYDTFLAAMRHPVGLVVLVGLTWAFFQKSLGGLRHLVMDTGTGFEIHANKRYAILLLIAPIVLTALTWAYLLGVFA